MAGEHAPVFLEVRPVGVGPPHDHAAPFGEGIGDGSEVERTAGEIPRSDREVLVVEEQCDAFVVTGHWPSLDVLVLWPVNDNVYIHEFIDIIGHNRANYMHHMTANFSPMAQEDRNQLCFGVWGIVGTTRGWPEVLNLWEERGFDGLATSFRFELGHSTLQDPKLAKWWAEASNYRRHGDDRVLRPGAVVADRSRARDAGRARARPTRTSRSTCRMGTARRLPRDRRRGGRSRCTRSSAGSCAARGRPRWSTSRSASCTGRSPRGRAGPRPRRPSARDSALQRWRKRTYELSEKWHRFLVVDAPLSPMRIGRQPARSDRDEGWEDL